MNEIESLISISNPNCKVLSIPAWDILPYDNSSPNKVLNGQRISTLSSLVNNVFLDDELVILTTFNSIFIKTAPFDFYENFYLDILISQTISISNLRDKLTEMGYTKVNTVRENNEFAVRGDRSKSRCRISWNYRSISLYSRFGSIAIVVDWIVVTYGHHRSHGSCWWFYRNYPLGCGFSCLIIPLRC